MFGVVSASKVVVFCSLSPFSDFTYVVNTKQGSRICFGTTLSRDTNPIGRGLSSFQKNTVNELFPMGPGYYDTEKITSALYLLNKVESRAGVGPLASKDPRFKERICFRTPSPGRYDITKSDLNFRQNLVPFGSSDKRRKTRTNNNPGPPTYEVCTSMKKYQRPRFCHHFGKPERPNAVEMICICKPIDACSKCGKTCQGDYWQRDYQAFLCQQCWSEERVCAEMYDEKSLKAFKKIRNCSFMHDHQDTSAAIVHLPFGKVKKKVRIENYLSSYLDS